MGACGADQRVQDGDCRADLVAVVCTREVGGRCASLLAEVWLNGPHNFTLALQIALPQVTLSSPSPPPPTRF